MGTTTSELWLWVCSTRFALGGLNFFACYLWILLMLSWSLCSSFWCYAMASWCYFRALTTDFFSFFAASWSVLEALPDWDSIAFFAWFYIAFFRSALALHTPLTSALAILGTSLCSCRCDVSIRLITGVLGCPGYDLQVPSSPPIENRFEMNPVWASSSFSCSV